MSKEQEMFLKDFSCLFLFLFFKFGGMSSEEPPFSQFHREISDEPLTLSTVNIGLMSAFRHVLI